MLLDHVDLILFDREFYILSLLGRIAFPLFAFMLVKNVLFYSKNIHKYALRLFIFALITQPIYMYVFNYDNPTLNIFFSLFIGLYFIYLLEIKYYTLTLFMICLSFFSEYSILSLLLIYALYYMFKEPFKDRRYAYLLVTLCLLCGIDYIVIVPVIFFVLLCAYEVELRLSLYDFLRKIVNLKIDRTPKYKYTFYAFYPIHLIFLELMK